MAAHGSSIAALQSSLTTGLSNKADQSAFDVLEGVVATKSTPDSVGLKLSNYSSMAAMNGSIASANNATLATVAANYHSLDIAARITPLEVDTKVANALLGVVSAAALASELASRDASISGLQASKADASALTAYDLQSAVNTSSVDSKITAALLDAVTTAALDAALGGKADASALAALLSTVDGLDTPLEVDTKIANGVLGLATKAFRDASISALQGAKADTTLLAGDGTLSITADLAAALLAYYTSAQVDALWMLCWSTTERGRRRTPKRPAPSRLRCWPTTPRRRWTPCWPTTGRRACRTHRQAAISGALLAYRTGPDQDVFTTNQITSALLGRRPGHGNGLEHRSRPAQLLHHRAGGRFVGRQARSHGGSLGRRGGGRHR